MESIRILLEKSIRKLPLPSSSSGSQALDSYLELISLLHHWSKKLNLTAHQTQEEIAIRLVLDSLAFASVLPEFSTLADLGSGAGFPGLPIAIAFPEARISSIEARERRVHFQKKVVRALRLSNVEVLSGRSDELDPQLHEGVVAQAMARPETAFEQMLPWCVPSGFMAIPFSSRSLELELSPGINLLPLGTYQVPIANIERTVLMAKPNPPGTA